MNTLRVWNEARINDLASLFHQGLSFALIAAEIGVTKNAACGKAHRMGLQPRVEIRSPPFHYAMKPVGPTALPVEAAALVGRDYRCSILDLTDVTCRFPLWAETAGEEDRWYCGWPTARLSEGRPYCKRHAQLSYTKR